MNSPRRLVHMIHINPRRVVFESSHEVFVVPLHDQGGLVAGDVTSQLPESVPHPFCTNAGYLFFLYQGCQSQKNGGKCCTRLSIRCNPGDVVLRIQLLNPDQYVAIEALGFGHRDGRSYV